MALQSSLILNDCYYGSMKYLVVTIILILALASFIFPVQSLRVPFAEEDPAPTQSFRGTEIEACTEKDTRPTGFPFRINLYDECKQDESTHVVAFLVNILIWVSIASFTFMQLSKRKS